MPRVGLQARQSIEIVTAALSCKIDFFLKCDEPEPQSKAGFAVFSWLWYYYV